MLADLIGKTLAEHHDGLAVADGRTASSYRELDATAGALANEIAGHVTAERPRVAICARNSVGYVAAYIAVLRLGGVPFLVDAAVTEAELDSIAEDCSLHAVLDDRPAPGPELGAIAGLRLRRRRPNSLLHKLSDGTEVCRFTSGTTGKPQCIEFSGDAVAAAARNWVAGTGLDGDDRIVCAAGLSNGLAFNTSLLACLLVGCQLHLVGGLPTAGRVSRVAARAVATRLIGFPALYDSFVRTGRSGGAFADVEVAISSGARLRPETAAGFRELTGITISNYYGIAETGPLTFARTPLSDDSLGGPLPGVRIEASTAERPDVLSVRSESMATGYLNAPGVFDQSLSGNGFYRTSDQGFLRAGELVLTGRVSQVINVGGRKVDPVEVADALRRLPGVLDAVVLEVPDRHGEPAVGAVLAPAATLDPAEVRRLAAQVLPQHKVPSLVRLVAEIPPTAIGKPPLARLRALFADRTEGI